MEILTRRFFYRCVNKECGKKWAVDLTAECTHPDARQRLLNFLDIKAYNQTRKMACPHCGFTPDQQWRGHKVLGFVRQPYKWELERRQRLVEEGQAAPCDGRCTNAVGPTCDCVCGGRNHGTKALVTVSFDRGPVPVAPVMGD